MKIYVIKAFQVFFNIAGKKLYMSLFPTKTHKKFPSHEDKIGWFPSQLQIEQPASRKTTIFYIVRQNGRGKRPKIYHSARGGGDTYYFASHQDSSGEQIRWVPLGIFSRQIETTVYLPAKYRHDNLPCMYQGPLRIWTRPRPLGRETCDHLEIFPSHLFCQRLPCRRMHLFLGVWLPLQLFPRSWAVEWKSEACYDGWGDTCVHVARRSMHIRCSGSAILHTKLMIYYLTVVSEKVIRGMKRRPYEVRYTVCSRSLMTLFEMTIEI